MVRLSEFDILSHIAEHLNTRLVRYSDPNCIWIPTKFCFFTRFLWDAHNCEESLNEDELGISANYLDHWNDLSDLWFLGMQVLNSLMPQVKTRPVLKQVSRLVKNCSPYQKMYTVGI